MPLGTTSTRPAPSGTTSTYTPTTYDPALEWHEAFFACLAVTVLTFLAAFLVADWGLLATGEAWQTAIGLALVGFVGIFSHYCWYAQSNIVCPPTLITVFSVVALLNWLFGGGITVMSMILSVGMAMLAIIFAYISYEECDYEYGGWNIILLLVNVANIIAGMIVYNYNVDGTLWQVLVALVLVIFVSSGAQVACDDSDHSIMLGLSVFGIIVSGCMLWWFGGHLAHFVSVLSLGVAALSICCGVYNVKEDEDVGIAVWCFITAAAHLAIFCVAHFVFG